MIVAGVGFLVWALTVWQWQDPFTAALNRLEQRELSRDFDRQLDEGGAALPAASVETLRDSLPRAAAAWRHVPAAATPSRASASLLSG